MDSEPIQAAFQSADQAETIEVLDEPNKQSSDTSDVANARRLANLYGDILRHKTGFGFFVWDGKRWERNKKAARRLAHSIGKNVVREAKTCDDEAKRDRLFKHAKRCESTAGIEAMLKEVSVMKGIDADAVEFDNHPLKLNVQNGTIDLRDGTLHSHNRQDYITKLAPIEYRPDAKCPRFEKFLSEIFAGDRDIVEYMQWLLGYSLTGLTNLHLFMILHGSGRNGKSTLVELFAAVLGDDYARAVDPEVLLTHQYAQHPTGRAHLLGLRFATSVESDEGRILDTSFIKNVTSGDRISARFLREEYFQFTPQLKLFLATNHKPVIFDDSAGMWGRIRLIPFNVNFEKGGRKPDGNLDQKLRKESEGILALAVQAIGGRLDAEPPVPAAVRSATERYRRSSDPTGLYLNEYVESAPGEHVPKAELYDRFAETMDSQQISKKKFGARVKEVGVEEGVVGGGKVRVWKNVRIRKDGEEPEDGTPPDGESTSVA